MLIVLVGTTLDVAKNSRLHFQKRGYSIIEKFTYRPDATVFSPISPPTMHTEEDVDSCDFVYPIHGGKTGFYKAQVMDAVRGRCNALIAMSPDNLDFISEILDTYYEYVIPVFLYIDETSLEAMTRKYIKDETMVQMRLATGKALRQMYRENLHLFKKTVIFSHEGDFDFDALYAQYDRIIDQTEALQKELNNRLYVKLPYKGNRNFIFVSYSHQDERTVVPYLAALQREGYRIWYDAGIRTGANWRILVGERQDDCTDFLLFSSKNAVASEEVQGEVNGSLSKPEIGHIIVRLDDAKFPSGFENRLQLYQNIYANESKNVLADIISGLNPSTKVLEGEEEDE